MLTWQNISNHPFNMGIPIRNDINFWSFWLCTYKNRGIDASFIQSYIRAEGMLIEDYKSIHKILINRFNENL